MTTATAAPVHPPRPTTIKLREPGDVIAALPPLLGYHPVDSLVVLYFADRDKLQIKRVLRAPLPEPAAEEELMTCLCDNILNSGAVAVQLCVIGGARTPTPPPDPGELEPVVALPTRPPRRALVLAFTQSLNRQGVTVVESLWAEHTGHNARWQDYEHPEVTGLVPDPGVSLLQVATIAAGGVTYESREAMIKALQGDEMDLRRRSCRLDWHTDNATPRAVPTTAAGIRAVQAQLKKIADGSFKVSDDMVVRLALALSDHRVRDVALTMTLGQETDRGAERLWLELTRATPAPECVEPATLLAFAAYQRGDGVLANIALEHALQAQPGHTLATLLSRAIDAGLQPKEVLTAINNSERFDLDVINPEQPVPVN